MKHEIFSNKHVVVVDDDAMVREIVCQYLRQFGFSHIKEFSDGDEVIRYLQQSGQPIDLILCDWQMPNSTGIEVLKATRRNKDRSQTKFVMVSSQRSQERFKILQAAQWKVDAYLIKPFRGDILLNKLLELCNRIEDERYADKLSSS